MDIKWREWARSNFACYGQEFEPKLILEDDNFFIMDWRDKHGSGNLATRYIVDKKKGDLIIKGDAGDCIASWYNEVTPEKLVSYINSTGYINNAEIRPILKTYVPKLPSIFDVSSGFPFI